MKAISSILELNEDVIIAIKTHLDLLTKVKELSKFNIHLNTVELEQVIQDLLKTIR